MENPYPYLETIRFENGAARLMEYHLERMARTCREAYGVEAPRLPELTLPDNLSEGAVKCRIQYGREIGSVGFERYAVRDVRSLRLVAADALDYHLKYADRSRLTSLHALREGADEVLIVREGFVTDTTYSNIVCMAGKRMLTPRRPLLRGVMREWLLATGQAEEAEITPSMLREGNTEGITAVCMINAMMPLGIGPVIELSGIR